jgi:hypothetical protein
MTALNYNQIQIPHKVGAMQILWLLILVKFEPLSSQGILTPFSLSKLVYFYITRSDCIKDLGVLIDSKYYFNSHVNYVFSQLIKFWGFIRNSNF